MCMHTRAQIQARRRDVQHLWVWLVLEIEICYLIYCEYQPNFFESDK